VALQFIGEWSAIQAYAVGDLVVSGDVSYECIQAHTNHVPPNATYWAVYSTTTARRYLLSGLDDTGPNRRYVDLDGSGTAGQPPALGDCVAFVVWFNHATVTYSAADLTVPAGWSKLLLGTGSAGGHKQTMVLVYNLSLASLSDVTLTFPALTSHPTMGTQVIVRGWLWHTESADGEWEFVGALTDTDIANNGTGSITNLIGSDSGVANFESILFAAAMQSTAFGNFFDATDPWGGDVVDGNVSSGAGATGRATLAWKESSSSGDSEVVPVAFTISDGASDGRMVGAVFAYTAPPVFARGKFLGTPTATPAHYIASPKGHAQSLKLGHWSATERANGGWIGQAGQLPKTAIDEDPALFAPRSNLYTVVKETGEILASCKLNEPGVNGGLADLAGQGPFAMASREFKRLFLQDPKIETWEEQGSEPHARGKPPKRGPDLSIGGAGNVNVGVHKYKITFVSADGETRGGPSTSITVSTSAKEVDLSSIPIGPKWVTARKIYRTEAGGSTFYELDTLADNTDTTYVDSTADAVLNLNPELESGFAATEIEVSKPDGEGVIRFHVARGADIEDQQLARIINDKDREKISRVAIRTDPSRDASGYTLLLQSAVDREHAFTAVDSWGCDELPGEIDVNVGTDASLVAFALRREGAVTNAQPFTLDLTDPRVNGLATGDFFDCSDVMRVGAAALGISDRYVKDSGVNCLPGDYRGMTWEEIFDLMSILTGWRWLIYRVGRRPVLDFRKWGAGGRKWTVFDPEAVRNLDPQPRFNYQTVQDPKGRVLASAKADPNPLDRIVEAPPIVLEHWVAKEKAKRLAQVSADFHSSRRYAGTIVCTRLMKNGRWHPAQDARAGDLVYEPNRRVTLRIDELEREQSLVTLTTLPRFQQLERFNLKLQKHLELVGKL
jgi:hypothetical protein